MDKIELTLKEICKHGNVPKEILSEVKRIKEIDA